jgi:ferredoxin--NADP+ reductase
VTHPIPTALPLNIIKPSAPYEATLLENIDLSPNSPDDVRHLVFDLGESGLRYVEGQSVGLIVPGQDAAGKPHRLRLYSIASSRHGDDGAARTISLCIKRTIYKDAEGTEIKGIASNFANDLQPGQTAKLCGPIGRHFLWPQEPAQPVLLIATGTGIAPFRAFLRYRETLSDAMRGPAYLVFGVRSASALLYDDELKDLMRHPGDVYLSALSGEQFNVKGGRMYVGDRLPELQTHIWPLLAEGRLTVYQCGLKGMEAGVEGALNSIAEAQGGEWEPIRAGLVAQKRWLVDTY